LGPGSRRFKSGRPDFKITSYFNISDDYCDVRHVSDDRIVAMIEIVSPGNKDSLHSIRTFVQKAGELLDRQIHLVFLDPFPPGPRDPNGIHSAIWEHYTGNSFTLPVNEPLTMVSYESGDVVRAYTETLAVGDRLPQLPLFLAPEFYIQLPLEEMYQAAWRVCPAVGNGSLHPRHEIS
jgi:Protein of unknown function (DUF4058)